MSELRLALEHVRRGRACIRRQEAVIEQLRRLGRGTTEAESVLHWMMELQKEFERDYRKFLRTGQERLEATGFQDPALNWPPESN
jgi:hypothetical protein